MVLELTPEGQSVAGRLLDGITAVNGQILAPLAPEEQEQFRNLLKRIV
jgi:DNA-binding MarR family transcriptional regulator